MTPQQMFPGRTQGAYGDQLLPGIGSQSSFQGQGHSRGQSRFSFGNDNPSAATNVKLSANPRAMAQQHSMMPTTMQSQGNNQYYPNSMPAPPPGLKSTGTPPAMFGQGFGSGGFGGVPKESNELLQTLLGRTTRGGNSQVHDQGKREYMISSFSNQYPPSSSSTPAPAPAPGLLASLYGNQPGAYQEFGSKQKKKGKKHRHANTSSSGGSGLVDLVDPSILQARMHQSQANNGAGQGLFGGQSQVDDDNLLSMEEARESVDALVSDEPEQLADKASLSQDAQDSPTPRPSVPPGFSVPAQGSSDAIASQKHPVTPVVPKVAHLNPSTASTPQQTPTKSLAKLAMPKRPGTGVPVPETSTTVSPVQSHTLNDEMFPALGTPIKEKRSLSPAVPAAPTPKQKAATKKSTKAKAKATPLNLATMSELGESSAAPSPTLVKAAPVESAAKPGPVVESSPASFPPLPSASGTSTPRVGPKTLRVLPAAKVESKSPASPIAPRAVSMAQVRPSTPASELASDSASFKTPSVPPSRAGSPPPFASIVGTAAVRTTTKSQQRKERKDRLKQDTKAIAETVAKDEPEAHAPVLGRKKKQKKEQPSKPPKAPKAPKEEPEKAMPPPPTTPESTAQSSSMQEVESRAIEAKETRGTKESQAAAKAEPVSDKPQTPSTSEMPANIKQEPIETDDPAEQQRNMGPASIFDDIKRELPKGVLQMLKLFPNTPEQWEHTKEEIEKAMANTSPPCSTTTCKCGEISESDMAILRQGKPVWKTAHHDGSRMMITPNGDCIRNLSPDEEARFLDLQNRVGKTATNPGGFVANRHQPGAGAFSLIKGRAVPNGRPNIFPTGDNILCDPVGKLQREDALGYINQYILPPLNLGTSNSGAPKGVSPTRDAAAASLNSLAPYFYGPDAAAGVGIYSPPDGMRAMQDLTGPLGRSDDAAKNGGFGGPAAGSAMPIMSVEDAEAAMVAARRETEKLKRQLNEKIEKNRILILSSF